MCAHALIIGGIALAGCGNNTQAPITPRTDILFGFYGGCPSCALETQDHTNLYMTRPWGPGGPEWLMETLPQLQQALGNGQKVMLGLPGAYGPNAEDEMRFALGRIKDAGLATHIVALYPIDEPDVSGKSDSEVAATNAMLRRVMESVGMNAALAVIYGCSTGRRPGIASYDWIGCDEYERGCDPANGARYTALKLAMRSSQRMMLIPGGANPWRQDTKCFADAANSDPQVAVVMPFLWVDWEKPGIRVNGMRKAYCEMGRSFMGANPATC